MRTLQGITKKFRKCCLGDDEEIKYYWLVKSLKGKEKFLLAYTSKEKFLLGLLRPFAKMRLSDEFTVKDISNLQFMVKTTFMTVLLVDFNLKGQKKLWTVSSLLPSSSRNQLANKLKELITQEDFTMLDFINIVYKQNKDALADYLKKYEIIHPIGIKKDKTLLFTKEKLLLLSFDGEKIIVEEEIDYSRITDFDIYDKKMSTLSVLYLEVDSQPRTYDVDLITPEYTDAKLNALIKILRDTNIAKPTPTYMEPDEEEIITFNIGIGIGGNKKFRLGSNNIYIIEKQNTGKFALKEKIPISEIQSIKADTLGSSLKFGRSGMHEIIIKTKDGKKHKFSNHDSERILANKAIDYIYRNINR